MIDRKKVLAIIPARGGSKGIPDKNIRLLAGRPLICWTIATALMVEFLDRVIVSTDAPEIARIAREAGAEAPFLRPKELARDDTTDMPVYLHTLQWLANYEAYSPDIVIWLRPTAPLRSGEDIVGALKLLLRDGEADWVRSVCPVEHHPFWMFHLEEDRMQSVIPGIDITRFARRQLLPPAYRLNGAVEVTWKRTLLEKQLFYCGDVRGYVMPLERSIDVDTEVDFLLAEVLLARQEV